MLLAKRTDAIATLSLALLVALIFSPFIFGHVSLMESTATAASLYSTGSRSPGLDIGTGRVLDSGAPAWCTEPWFVLEHNIISGEHVVPVWNPYSSYGAPLAANMQSQIFFPPTWIAVAFDNSTGYAVWIALRLFLAGFLTYCFLRRFFAEAASFVGAVAYMFTGYLLVYLTMPEQSVSVVIPALLWAIVHVCDRPSPLSASLLAFAIAAVVLGGMPEVAFLAFLLGAVFFVQRLLKSPIAKKVLIFGTSGTVLGIGIAAIQILPFLEFVAHSTSVHGGGPGVPLPSAASDTFDLAMLVTYIAPLVNGAPENNIFDNFTGFNGARGFLGAAVSVLAIFEIVAWFRMRSRGGSIRSFPTLLFATVATFFLLRRFGNPLATWVQYVPFIRQVTLQKYEEVIIGICVALIAAAGAERLRLKQFDRFDVIFSVGAVLSVLSAYAAMERDAVAALVSHTSYYYLSLIIALSTLIALLIVFLLRERDRLNSFAAGALTIALVIGNVGAGYIVPMFYIVDHGASDSFQAANGTAYVTALQRDAAPESRIFGEDNELYPNWSGAFGLYDPRGLDALLVDRYLGFANIFLPPSGDYDLKDRFVGNFSIDFTDRLQRRFLEMSSVGTVIAAHPMNGLLEQIYDAHLADASSKFRTGFFTVGGVVKPGLFMHPPTDGEVTQLSIPSGATSINVSIGMLDGVFAGSPCGDGVRFDFEAREASGRLLGTFSRYIDPKHIASDRHWFAEKILLPSGLKTVSLKIKTSAGPSGSLCSDWATWGDMYFASAGGRRIVSRDAFSSIFSDDIVTLYRTPQPIPRIGVYESARTVDSPAAARATLASNSFDPLRQAVLESSTEASTKIVQSAQPAQLTAAKLEVYRSTYVRARASSPRPAVVVLNDTNYPGWVASVDGRKVPILKADYLFRGVLMPAGTHTIEFAYKPVSYEIGAIVSVVSLLGTVMLMLAPFARAIVYRRTKKAI